MKAEHGKKLWDLLRVLTLMVLVTAALAITPPAPAVANGGEVSIDVKPGYPTEIPADGKSSTVLVVKLDGSSEFVQWAQEFHMAGTKGKLKATVSTTLGYVENGSVECTFAALEATLATLQAGKEVTLRSVQGQVGEAIVTVKIVLEPDAEEVLDLGTFLELRPCEDHTTVSFVEPGTEPEETSPGDVSPDKGKSGEPGKQKPRLTEEMIDDMAFVVAVGLTRGMEIRPEQLPHWDKLTPGQQARVTQVLVALQVMWTLSQIAE